MGCKSMKNLAPQALHEGNAELGISFVMPSSGLC
jgi:hypothetical protein